MKQTFNHDVFALITVKAEEMSRSSLDLSDPFIITTDDIYNKCYMVCVITTDGWIRYSRVRVFVSHLSFASGHSWSTGSKVTFFICLHMLFLELNLIHW